MRVLLFLSVFYSALIIYGMNVSYAKKAPEPCQDIQCMQQKLSSEGQSDEELISQIQKLMEMIEDKISKEKMQTIIQQAAEKNPQVKHLLDIIQEYGVLTDIEIKDTSNKK